MLIWLLSPARSLPGASSRNRLFRPEREREVVQLIAEGHSHRQIADMLGITVKAVESHRTAAMRKLNLSTAAGLVRYAIRNNLVEP
jgi:DNA-binding NarL/FixJ family response regulator